MKKPLQALLCLSLMLCLCLSFALASEEPAAPAEESFPAADGADPTPEITSATPTDAYDENGNLVTAGTVPGTSVTWRYADGVLSIGGTGAMPDFDNGSADMYPPWFAWTDKIRKLAVGGGVTRVGGHAADMCTGLKELELAEGIKELGPYAFSGCAGLTEVTLPSTLEIIGDGCFSACAVFDDGLTSIALPEGLRRIGNYAFQHDILSDVTLPKSLEYIGEGAFMGTILQEVTVPGGAALGKYAFRDCMQLRSAVVEEGAAALPEQCFAGCRSLQSLTLPSSLREIGPAAVANTALSDLSLPSGENYTFAGWADEDGELFTGGDIAGGASYAGTLTACWLRTWAEGRFSDVSSDAWYHDAVALCWQAELMNGVSETLFAPGGSATRGQVVTVLWRLAGEPVMEDRSLYTAFSDIPGSAWYRDAVAWAAAFEITTGYPDGTFRPNDAVTRQEFLTFLYRFTESWAGEQPPACDAEPLEPFSDRDAVASWAEQAECWSVSAGLQTGSENGDGTLSLNPRQSIRRSELAMFLARYCVALSLL